MLRLQGYIQLTRPLNLIIAFFSIFVGGFVTGTIQPITKLLLACMSGVLVMAGANSVNDYYDLDIDRINKPNRPLPAGRVRPIHALLFSLILFGSAVLASVFIHFLGFIIALSSSLLLYLYSYKLKRTVLWGNLTVALVTGLAFVFGGLAVNRLGPALIVGCFAFFFHLGREIIKDMEDMEGDRAQAIQTLPIQFGLKSAMILTTTVLVILLCLTLIPYFVNIFSLPYLIVVVVGVDFFLVYVIISMWTNPVSVNFGRLSLLMKLDMFIGLMAVYLGK